MYKVKLNWHILKDIELDSDKEILDEKIAIFMLICAGYNELKKVYEIDPGKPPLYIGQVYNKECKIRRRIKEHLSEEIHASLNSHCAYKVLIKVAEMITEAGQDPSPAVTVGVTCGLVFKSQPLCNVNGKDKYPGGAMSIMNTGSHLPLKEFYTLP